MKCSKAFNIRDYMLLQPVNVTASVLKIISVNFPVNVSVERTRTAVNAICANQDIGISRTASNVIAMVMLILAILAQALASPVGIILLGAIVKGN